MSSVNNFLVLGVCEWGGGGSAGRDLKIVNCVARWRESNYGPKPPRGKSSGRAFRPYLGTSGVGNLILQLGVEFLVLE